MEVFRYRTPVVVVTVKTVRKSSLDSLREDNHKRGGFIRFG